MSAEETICPKCNSPYAYTDGLLWICPECSHEWTPDQASDDASKDAPQFIDANGNQLQDGDTVTTIKDLKAGKDTMKLGTKVKNIKLLDDPVNGHDISCKIPGFGAMYLKCSVVKKGIAQNLTMLKNSFQHIPGIGAATEAQLWASGLLEWQQVQSENTLKIPAKRFEAIAEHTKTAIGHLESKNPAYFADLLPAKEHWRLFDAFRDSTAYVDIETTGLRSYGFEITTIALYDGKEIRHYVQGQNLEQFIEDIQNYNLLVTYNGKTFDVPFIQDQFGIQLNHAHIDLRYVLKSLGYSGGLKSCEKALGLDRGDLDGVDGYFAVFLWHEYRKNNDEKALETLLAYNIEDVVNLETLMVTAYNMKLKETPFEATHELPLPKMPEIPFKPDLKTIDRIKTAMIGSYAG